MHIHKDSERVVAMNKHVSLEIVQEPHTRKKIYITFPFPYMNGRLHIGHGFTLIKGDILAKYKRMNGYDVLFPFAFHCTGMPIKAASDNLREELTSGKKGKQYSNMVKMGIPENEIPRFIDPTYFFEYFPKHAMSDLKKLQVSVDWTRSFITTNSNPYYSKFVQWQFNKLRDKGLVYFGSRHVIWSTKNNQACSDHARASGEGVKPKKYGLIFLKLLTRNVFQEKFSKEFEFPKEFPKELYISVMTSDTSNAQSDTQSNTMTVTHLEINPNHEFICVKLADGKFVIMNEWCATNCSFQNFMPEFGSNAVNSSIFNIKGSFLVGMQCGDDVSNALEIKPNSHIKPYKGSGIVFKKNNDNNDIKEIHVTKRDYYEPADKVVARSGDRCIVAYGDGWFLKYSDESWKTQTIQAIETHMTELSLIVKEMLIGTVKSFQDKTFSRSKETTLGTEIPWEQEYYIDSLSDSTVYMMYYTICNFLHTDINGQTLNEKYNINASQMTYDVWDFIFLDGVSLPKKCGIDESVLYEMQKEFQYWYPLDMRISAKDLLSNHLPFCLMHHLAILGKDMIPRNIFINGYLTINNNKMSKSVGNFVTLRDAIEKYTVDATRFTLADSGDDINDGMFDPGTATTMIDKLQQKIEWTMANYPNKDLSQKHRDGYFKHIDTMFHEQMQMCLKNAKESYEQYRFKRVCHWAFNELDRIRKNYENWCTSIGMHSDLIRKYVEVQTLFLAPIIPNYCGNIWNNLLKKKDCILDAEFPVVHDYSENIIDKCMFWENIWKDIHHQLNFAEKKKIAVKCISLEFVRNVPQWHRIVSDIMNDDTKDKREKIKNVSAFIGKQKINKKEKKKIIGSIAKNGCLDLTSFVFKDSEFQEMVKLMNDNIQTFTLVYKISDERDDLLPNKAKVILIKKKE